MKRSDSTLELRTRLNNDYVIVPSIRNTIPLLKDIDILYTTLKSAQQFDTKNLLSQSYIDYKTTFKTLVKAQQMGQV